MLFADSRGVAAFRRVGFFWLVLVASAPAFGQGYFLSQTFNDPTVTSSDRFGWSVAIDGNYILVGARNDDTNGGNAGQAHLYDTLSGSLLQTFNDPTVTSGDNFGWSVAIDGNNILIGDLGDDTNGSFVGQAHLFDAVTGSLLQTFDDPTVTNGDQFGVSVAIDENYVLIGASTDDTNGSNVGQAHLFDAASGNLLQTFSDPTVTLADQFGTSVAIDGNNVLIGASSDDTNGSGVGQAHLFDAVSGNLLQTFNDPTVTSNDFFGTSVAIDGNNVVIGATGDDTNGSNVGQAHLFDAVSGNLLRTFNDPTVTSEDRFGTSVAIDGNNVLIGASSDDTNGSGVGQAHLFDAVSGNLLQTFNDPTVTSGDGFGYSVAIDGNNVLIGAISDDTNGSNVGQAHLFSANSTTAPRILIDPNTTGATDVFSGPTRLTNPQPSDLDLGGGNLLVGGNAAQGELLVAGGATLASNEGFISPNAGNVGVVTVTGPGSQWTTAVDLEVGAFGEGSLTVDDGATVTSGNRVYVGRREGAVGNLTVSGGGSLQVTDILHAGYVGNGHVDITNGGSATANELIVSFSNRAVGFPQDTLDIASGGTVSIATDTIIGFGSNTDGLVTVDGAGSALNTTGELRVGNQGTGTLIVENGGLVQSTGDTFLARNGGSTGQATIRGADSSLAVGQALHVGAQGAGTLNIESGATVTSASGLIGSGATGSGTATVTGAGSSWTSTGDLTVAPVATTGGPSSLEITNGGTVSNAFGTLGDALGSTGTATVTGADSTWTSTGNLRVGRSGTGTLTVQDGATVTNTVGWLGIGSQASGTATVTGPGSSWTSSSTLNVGAAGAGVLTIENGGAVSNAVGLIGRDAGSTGDVSVDGAGSTWTNLGSRLSVGESGTGSLTITGGGAVTVLETSDTFIGQNSTAVGAVTVDGIGSSFDGGDDIFIGFTGQGDLTVFDGATATARAATLGRNAGSTGNAEVSGADSRLSITDALFVGRAGVGDLVIQNGGSVTSDVAAIALEAGSNGTVTIDGAGSTWTNTGSLAVGGGSPAIPGSGGVGGTATLNVDGGMLTNGGELRLWNGSNINLNGGTIRTQSFDNTAGGTFDHVDGELIIDGGAFEPGGAGDYLLDSAAPDQRSVLTLAGTATFDRSGGRVFIGNNNRATLNVQDTATVTADGLTVGSQATADGLVDVSGGSVSVTTSVLIGNFGAGAAVVRDTGQLVADEVSVGHANGATGSQSNLTIQSGGSVTANQFTIGNGTGTDGAVGVEGVGSALAIGGNLGVGRAGAGTLNVLDGAAADANVLEIGLQRDSVGALEVSGAGSTVDASNFLTVGVDGEGSLSITGGGVVSAQNVFVARDAASTGIVTVEGVGSELRVADGLSVVGQGIGRLDILNGGVVDVANQVNVARSEGSFGEGVLFVFGGSISAGSYRVGQSAGAFGTGRVTIANGSLNADGDLEILSTGTLDLQGGEAAASALSLDDGGTFNWTGGRLSVGTYNGDLTQTAGTLAAGNSPGVTNITGNYTLNTGGTLEVELAGQGGMAGTDFDFYSVTGDATLTRGLIDIVPVDGFNEVIGQSYDVLTAANLTVEQRVLNRVRPEFSASVEPGGNGSLLRLTQETLLAYDWTNPAGGDFQTASNWSAGAVPGSDRPIRFNLPGETYTVTHTADRTNPFARVEAGDVTFDLSGNTQTLTSTRSNAPSLFVASGTTAMITNGSVVAEEVRGFVHVDSTADVIASSVNGGVILDGGTLTTGTFSGNYDIRSGGTLTTESLTASTGTLENGELAIVGGVYAPSSTGAQIILNDANPILTLDAVNSESQVFSQGLVVGTTERGTLNIRGGTEVFATTISVGTFTNPNNGSRGNGVINVEGVGSRIEVSPSRSFFLGTAGNGSLAIRDGGVVDAAFGVIGESRTGAGSILVEGMGSELAVRTGSNFILGRFGLGAVVVSDGGKLVTATAVNSSGQGFGQVFLGFEEEGVGSVTVTGEGSLWDADSTIYVGGNQFEPMGTGTLRVGDGGAIHLRSTIRNPSTNDWLKVWSGSQVILAGGTISSEGETTRAPVDLAAGSRLSGYGTISASINSAADVTVAGGLLEFTGSSVSLRGDTLITSSGTLATSSFSPFTEVQGGAIIAAGATLDAGKLITGYGIVVGELSGPGTNLLATNPTGTVDFRGTLDVGADTATVYSQGRPTISGELSFLPGGQLVTPGNDYLVSGSGVIRGAADLSGQRFTGAAGSTVRAEGGLATGPTNVLALGDPSAIDGFYSNGRLVVEAGANLRLDDANGAVLDSGALVTLGVVGDLGATDAAVLSAPTGLTLDFGGNVLGAGTIDTPNDAATPFVNNGHLAGDSLASPITLTGYVKGVGTLDNVVIAGTDAPGFSPATVNRGSVAYEGTLEIELGGTAAGQFDKLNHLLGAGDALLGGELLVSLIDGYTPSAGDTFDFLTATGDLTGVFATESLPEFVNGLRFEVLYGVDTVRLAVAGVEGDYNFDGVVNTADYATWRDGLGSLFTEADYAVWFDNVGQTAFVPSLPAPSAFSVPEPSSAVLLAASLCLLRRRSR